MGCELWALGHLAWAGFNHHRAQVQCGVCVHSLQVPHYDIYVVVFIPIKENMEEHNDGFGAAIFDPEQGKNRKLSSENGSWTTAIPLTLGAQIMQLQEPLQNDYLIKDINRRKDIIVMHMGSMAQCRGKLGDKLREAGAINCLLSLLYILICDFIDPAGDFSLRINNEILELIIASLGALRDLACGSAMNRLCIGSYTVRKYTTSKMRIRSGIDIIVFFIKKYHSVSWNEILFLEDFEGKHVDDKDEFQQTRRGKLELKILTLTTGVVRNITHSTRINCEELHNSGVTELFIWRLQSEANLCVKDEMSGNNSTTFSRLPDPSKPWREASFRIASSLINMAEKCNDCASRCAADDGLMYILLESWGGKTIYDKHVSVNKFPVLHLGLIAVLSERLNGRDHHGEEELEKIIQNLFVREASRKKSAQARELNRKAKGKK